MIDESEVVCKVCSLGKIVTRVTKKRDIRTFWEKFRGRPERWETVSSTSHCNVCGVKYEFCPAEKLEPARSTRDMVQVSPWLLQGRDTR